MDKYGVKYPLTVVEAERLVGLVTRYAPFTWDAYEALRYVYEDLPTWDALASALRGSKLYADLVGNRCTRRM